MTPFNRINFEDLTPSQILVSGYFIVILTGTILLMLPQATTSQGGMNLIDSLFTATSATCVTGLIVVNTSTAFTVFGQVVIMLLIQIGGLGLMTMSTMFAFILGKKITLKERLIIQEDLNHFKIQGLVQLVRYVLGFTMVIEGTGAFFLFMRLIREHSFIRALYLSIFHAVSAFNNAGFDLFGNSLEDFTGDITINFTVMFLIILGGIGFGVMVELYNNFSFHKISLQKVSLQTKIVLITTLILLIVGFILIFGLEYFNPETMGELPLGEKMLSSLFLSVTPRTAGFNTVPTGALRESTLFLIIVLMFIGASPGSTGGGIKTTTMGVMLINLKSMITANSDIEAYNRRLVPEIVLRALSITLLSAGLVVLVTITLTVTEGMPFLEIFFETVSAFGTVGLSTGVTPHLTRFGRVLIIITMFAGRVGPLTLALALGEKKRRGMYHYPKEDVMVG